jgi:hypothetical protein
MVQFPWSAFYLACTTAAHPYQADLYSRASGAIVSTVLRL